MIRYDYYTKEYTSEGVDFFNLTKINWKNFKPKSAITIHTVSSDEVDKPYLISYREWASPDYEDLIFLVNGILNPFSLYIGQQLQIPKLTEILEFMNE